MYIDRTIEKRSSPRHRSQAGLVVPLLALVLASIGSHPIRAQSAAGSVVGTVHDASGAVILGANVTLVETSTLVTKAVKTLSSGDYTFSFVQPGNYKVKVEARGFAAIERPIRVDLGSTVRADFDLTVGGTATQVTVLGTAPLLQTDSAEVSDVISQRSVNELPLNGRQYSDLILLTPGATISAAGTSDTPLLQTGLDLNVNGARPTQTAYSIDGVTATDYYFDNLSASTSIDFISEFKVLSGQQDASLGNKGGGQVVILTKSGTNAFHGTLFEFVRNSAFDSKNFFTPAGGPVPPLNENQFGASVGGPILHEKLFFFANYEGDRTSNTLTTVGSVPTLAMRAGDFSAQAPIYDPTTTLPNGTRTQFPGNKITKIDPAAAYLLKFIPQPTSSVTSNNYNGSGMHNEDQEQGNGRIDYTAGANSIFGRLSINRITEFDPFGSRGTNVLPGFASNVSTDSTNVAINYTRVFSNSFVMNVLVGFNRVNGGIGTTNQAEDFGTAVNIFPLNQNPQFLRGIPVVSTTFDSPFGDDTSTLFRKDNTFQEGAQFTYIFGKHSLTFGGQVMRQQFNPLAATYARGSYTFSPRYTSSTQGGSNGNGFADFLLGLPFSALALEGNAYENGRSTWYGGFIQDNWHMLQRLTLNLGLRYDYIGPLYDWGDRLSSFDIPSQRVVISAPNGTIAPNATYTAGVTVPFVTSQTANWPRSLYSTGNLDFAPRVGLAYSVTPTFVIRGGYSLIFSSPPLNLQARMDRNPPFSELISPQNPLVPGFTTSTAFTGALGTPSFGLVSRDFLNVRVQEWSFGLQTAIGTGRTVDVGYVGSTTDRLDWQGPGNPATPCATNCPSLTSRLEYPALGSFTLYDNAAKANYNALQVAVKQQAWNGLFFDFAFTYSKTLADSSSSSGDSNLVANNPADVLGDYGPASFDHRIDTILSGGYDLPFGRGKQFLNNRGALTAIAGNWQLGGIFNQHAGEHLSVGISSCPANNGAGCRTNLNGNPNLDKSQRLVTHWFNTAEFAASPAGTFGNQRANSIVGPGYVDLDFYAHKQFLFGEERALQLRVETFNLFNHPDFGNPISTFGASNFGSITSAMPAREFQFGAKFNF